MAVLSKGWLKPIYNRREESDTPVEVTVKCGVDYRTWTRLYGVVALFRMSQADSSYELLGLQAEDVDLFVRELVVRSGKETRTSAAVSLLKELTDKELVAVLSEVFAQRRSKRAG